MTHRIESTPTACDAGKRFTIRALLIATTCMCIYLSLAKVLGFGRATVCSVALLQFVASVLFFSSGYWSWRDKQPRKALGACLLGLMVLAGAILFGVIVFQTQNRTPIGVISSEVARELDVDHDTDGSLRGFD